MKANDKSLGKISGEWLEKRTDLSGPAVLIADDSEADIFMLLRAFASARVKNPVHVVRSGKEAMDYLGGEGKFSDRERFPFPKIVFLDLKMPHPDGFEVLRWKNDHRIEGILWVATSNFDAVKTINEAYSAGATTFLTKPLDAHDVSNLIEAFEQFWTIRARTELGVFGVRGGFTNSFRA